MADRPSPEEVREEHSPYLGTIHGVPVNLMNRHARQQRGEAERMDRKELERAYVEEYLEAMARPYLQSEVRELKHQVSQREHEISRLEDRVFDLEGELEDARQSIAAVRDFLQRVDSRVATVLRDLLIDPGDTQTRKRLADIADQLEAKR